MHTSASIQSAIDADTLLLTALRAEIPAWPADGPGVGPLLHRARLHGVIPLLYQSLTRNETTGCPAELLGRLAAETHALAACDLLIERELRRVLDALQAAQIEVLLLKGVSLAYSLYADPALRPRGDTDMLVAEQDKAVLAKTLESLGYHAALAHGGGLVSHQATYHIALAPEVGHDIDMHWRLFNLQGLADVLSFNDLRTERVPLPRLHPHALGPSLVHGLLHACLHGAAHHGEDDRLIWLWDMKLLAAVLDDAQRSRIARLCDDLAIRDIVHESLAAAHQAFTGPALQKLLDALPADPKPRRRIPGAGARHVDVVRADLKALAGWQQRMQYIWQHAVPPPEYMLQRYGARTRVLLPWLYLRRWFAGFRKLFQQRYSNNTGDSNHIT